MHLHTGEDTRHSRRRGAGGVLRRLRRPSGVATTQRAAQSHSPLPLCPAFRRWIGCADGRNAREPEPIPPILSACRCATVQATGSTAGGGHLYCSRRGAESEAELCSCPLLSASARCSIRSRAGPMRCTAVGLCSVVSSALRLSGPHSCSARPLGFGGSLVSVGACPRPFNPADYGRGAVPSLRPVDQPTLSPPLSTLSSLRSQGGRHVLAALRWWEEARSSSGSGKSASGCPLQPPASPVALARLHALHSAPLTLASSRWEGRRG